jgi:hypothetical protein
MGMRLSMNDRQKRIIVSSKAVGRIEAEMTDENPSTASAVWNALPIKGKANRWGDEIYFSTPINLREENSKEEVAVGSLAYWPPGKAVCIFFGETPVSQRGEPRAYSPVNVFAKIIGDHAVFKKVRDGDQVTLERA